jgi:HSP20 family molecular chaperone IbpA
MAQEKEKMTVSVGRARRPADENAFAPLVDIYETPDGGTMLVAELPGAKPDAVDIRVDKGVLTVTADAPLPDPPKDYAPTYTGFTGGQYFRAFALSDEIDRDKIEASLADGVLTLKLPRAAAAQTKKIQIKA